MNRTPARVATIEGQRTLIVDRTPPLPKKLDTLLGSLFAVSVRNDIRPTGASTACEAWRTHRFEVLAEGRNLGTDRVIRDLRITMCLDCGAVCVRDVSYDRLPDLRPGRRGPARRDLVLGWYTGASRNGRTYR